MVSIVLESQRMVGTESGSGRGLILDWTGSWQLDKDLDNLTHMLHANPNSKKSRITTQKTLP